MVAPGSRAMGLSGECAKNNELIPARTLSPAAENDAATVVLDRTGEDLRRGGAGPVDEHRQGAAPDLLDPAATDQLHPAMAVADLHDRTGAGEEAGEIARLVQGSPAVAAQVDDQAVDPLDLEFG